MEEESAIHKLVVERLHKWASGGKAPPTKATLIITDYCNLNCLFCRGAFRSKEPGFYKDEFTTEKWISVAKEGAQLGIKEWAITGGEPFMRTDTVAGIISVIKSEDPSSLINLTTSGSFLTLEVANEIVKLGCNKIEVGIDAPNAKIHDFLRGREGSFETATNSIKYLAYAKRKLGKQEPRIILKTVLNSKNYDKLPEMVVLANFLGADAIDVVPLRMYEENLSLIEKNGLKMNDNQKDEMDGIWRKVEEAGKKHRIDVVKEFTPGTEDISKIVNQNLEETPNINNLFFSFTPLLPLIQSVSSMIRDRRSKKETSDSINKFLSAFCFAPFYSLIIDPKGNVGPCSSIPPSEFENLPFLNLRENTLEDIWYGQFFDFIRNLSIEGKHISKRCKSCGLVKERRSMLNDMKNFDR